MECTIAETNRTVISSGSLIWAKQTAPAWSRIRGWRRSERGEGRGRKTDSVLPRALSQMNAPSRMIFTQEVRAAGSHGAEVEDYAEYVPGHSCLILGWGDDDRQKHVVCAEKPDYLAIISAYMPIQDVW